MAATTNYRKAAIPHLARTRHRETALFLGIAACALIALLSRQLGSRRGPNVNTDAIVYNDQFVVITDNPFLIPNLPERRKNELLRAVRMNLDSPIVSSLHLLNQAPNSTLYPVGKLHVYDLGWRSTILDAIRYANAVLPPKTMFVIANADIVFAHESVRLIPRIKDPNTVVALSRHDVHENGQGTLHEDPPLSQDAWFMRTPFPEHPGFDFPMGALGSDNKLAHLFKSVLSKTVVNWCDDVVIWHFHSSQHRGAKARLPHPYGKVPNARVNISMLATSWQTTRIKLASKGVFFSPSIRAIALDLPRLSELAMTTSNVKILSNVPQWPLEAVGEMLRIAKRRARASKYGKTHKRALSTRQLFFLDIPWHLVDRALIRDVNLTQILTGDFPEDVAPGQLFALVPEEIVPVLCRGAPEWQEVSVGSMDAAGNLLGEVVCPALRAQA